MIVTLTESEWVIATHIAHLRQAQNKSAGLPDQRQSKAVDQISINYAREIAVCKSLNFFPDLEFMRPGIADASYRGRTIDVKKMTPMVMNVRVKPGKRSDIYVGCAYEAETHVFDIVGFTYHDRLEQQMQEYRIENTDGTHYFSIPIAKLFPISKIDDCVDWMDGLLEKPE